MLAYSSQPFLLQDRLIIFIAFSQIFVTPLVAAVEIFDPMLRSLAISVQTLGWPDARRPNAGLATGKLVCC